MTWGTRKRCIYVKYYTNRDIMRSRCCRPVGSIVFRSAGNILWIICELILLDFRLQVFGFGSAGPGTWSVTAFAIQLLFLWFMARRGSGVRVFPQLQEPLVSLLVLPVCEDLRHSTGFNSWMVDEDDGVALMGPNWNLGPRMFYLSLLLQSAEAAAGGGQERLQLQLQGVQLLDADPIVLRAAQHGGVAGAHLDVLDGLEVVVFEWGAVLQLTHDAARPATTWRNWQRTVWLTTGLLLLLLLSVYLHPSITYTQPNSARTRTQIHVHAGLLQRTSARGPNAVIDSYMLISAAAVSHSHILPFNTKQFPQYRSRTGQTLAAFLNLGCLSATTYTVSEWRPWWGKPLWSDRGVEYSQIEIVTYFQHNGNYSNPILIVTCNTRFTRVVSLVTCKNKCSSCG